MSRFLRISTIARKELVDTLRDRRTLIAMVLVPLAVYPALILGSLQAFQTQVGFLVVQQYDVAVVSDEVRDWLRQVIDTDEARRQSLAETNELPAQPEAIGPPAPNVSQREQSVRKDVYTQPPKYNIVVVPDVQAAVDRGEVHAGVIVEGELPHAGSDVSARVRVLYDDTDIRSSIAASGLAGILERFNAYILSERLMRRGLTPEFIRPLDVHEVNVASAERMAGAVLGQIVPLILIVMTITGAIYPAIDLTAGERERGTLETLMAAPVPPLDLIIGKFVVVTLIGLLSAVLNLASIGGTMALGGAGSLLTAAGGFSFPFSALPWIFPFLVPLAVMFSALLLAVCSFARSFKEAQNYIVPVMLAALIPGVVGVLPGTRLEGPIVIMPVANIVVLTRELFVGRFDFVAISWVLATTSLYAATAVAIAARLFGQEAVLFSDAVSLRTILNRRFFKPAPAPSAAQALLVLVLVYSLNFFLQQALLKSRWSHGPGYLAGIDTILVLLLFAGPYFAARYLKIRPESAFSLRFAPARAWLGAVLLGSSTWLLMIAWTQLQSRWFPFNPILLKQLERSMGWLDQTPLPLVIFALALVPAFCEELFFRGYVLSGLRSGLRTAGALVVMAIAFGLYHYDPHRFVGTAALGLLLGLIVVASGSVYPAMLAHFMHNAISLAIARDDGLRPLLTHLGFDPLAENATIPLWWLCLAALLTLAGLLLCFAPQIRRLLFGTPDWPARDAPPDASH